LAKAHLHQRISSDLFWSAGSNEIVIDRTGKLLEHLSVDRGETITNL
jgi:hypothetical protein